jgi:hypothetical protein
VSFLGRRYFKLPILSCPRIPPATQAKEERVISKTGELFLRMLKLKKIQKMLKNKVEKISLD